MSRFQPTAKLLVAALALAASPALADVMNGDFENGGDQWQINAPFDWQVSFPPAGGNPGGLGTIQSPFGGDGGEGCLMQTFVCGDPGEEGTCTITLDYFLDQLDASPNSARIIVRIDGAATTFAPEDDDWRTATLTVPCGAHVLELCLEVDPVNNGWLAGFDNVAGECDGVVAAEGLDWGALKTLYHR